MLLNGVLHFLFKLMPEWTQVSGKPIKLVGRGERMEDLEPFYPDRMAGRILGMGDVLSFVEKAQEVVSFKYMWFHISTKRKCFDAYWIMCTDATRRCWRNAKEDNECEFWLQWFLKANPYCCTYGFDESCYRNDPWNGEGTYAKISSFCGAIALLFRI